MARVGDRSEEVKPARRQTLYYGYTCGLWGCPNSQTGTENSLDQRVMCVLKHAADVKECRWVEAMHEH